MRIGIFYETTFPEFKGGVERWFAQLARGLNRESIEVTYFNTSGKSGEEDGISYDALENRTATFHLSGERSTRNTIAFAFSVFRRLKNIEIDVVYLSAFPFFHILAAKIARRIFRKTFKIYVEWFELPSKRFWITEFGIFVGVTGYLIQTMSVRQSDVNVAYLESTAKELARLGSKKQEILKLPGICTEYNFEGYPISNSGRNDICQIGRLTPDKQPLLGLKTIEKLIEKGWTGNFHIVGSGPLEQEIEDYILQHKMSNKVKLHIGANEVLREKVLNDCALLLHPSKREGFGLVIVEAATVGIPAILINNPNNKSPELGINPTLVATSEDPDELVQIIQSFFNDTDTYVRECLEWNLGKRKQMLATSSIKGLVAHFNNQIDKRKKNE